MRIVALADTHMLHADLRVPDGDVLVHAGDLTAHGGLAELARCFEWLASLPHAHKLVIAGNHDLALERTPQRARAMIPRGVTYLEDEAVVIDGVHFYGTPWTPAFMDLAFNAQPGEELAAIVGRIPREVDVLVTHGPPFGHGDRSLLTGTQVGCRDLLARIRAVQPPLNLFGHIHEGGGVTHEGRTACVNATNGAGARQPTVVSYDPRTRQVVLETVPPR